VYPPFFKRLFGFQGLIVGGFGELSTISTVSTTPSGYYCMLNYCNFEKYEKTKDNKRKTEFIEIGGIFFSPPPLFDV